MSKLESAEGTSKGALHEFLPIMREKASLTPKKIKEERKRVARYGGWGRGRGRGQ